MWKRPPVSATMSSVREAVLPMRREPPTATSAAPAWAYDSRRGARLRAAERLEDGGPVILDACHRPAVAVGALERLLGAGRVVELAVGIVVQHEQPQERPGLMLGEVEHRDVPVRVPGGEQ